MSNLTGFIRSCQISSKVKDFALEEKTDNHQKKREAHDFIMETYSANAFLSSNIIRLVVLCKSRSDIIQIVEAPYSTVSVSSEAILSLPYFDTLHSNPGKISTGILVDPFITTKNISMIPFVHSLAHPYQAGEIGYIYTEISPAVITKPIENYLDDNESIIYFHMGDYLYQYDNKILIPCETDFSLLEDLSASALSSDTHIQRIRQAGEKNSLLMITRPLDTDGWYISIALHDSSLSQNIFRTFFLITLVILSACSVIGIMLSLFLSKTVNTPVKQLQARMKRIANGDFERDFSIEWEHELGDIGKNINDLSENVQTLLNQRIEDERQKKNYEYRMLQSQINPHFLYNTLNSIKWMATIQNAPGIAEMTTSLSRLLKDISKRVTSLVSLAHEISLLNDYFTIQQYRYGGTITLNYQIEDETLTKCNILKFTLQPIVENAIFHGIEPKGAAGCIDIHIYQDDNTDIHIDITDDGVGMSKEVATHLLDNEETPPSTSFFKEIGVRNVHKRLQYEFGSQYGLSVTSQPGKFTTISILLPFQINTTDEVVNKEEKS